MIVKRNMVWLSQQRHYVLSGITSFSLFFLYLCYDSLLFSSA